MGHIKSKLFKIKKYFIQVAFDQINRISRIILSESLKYLKVSILVSVFIVYLYSYSVLILISL